MELKMTADFAQRTVGEVVAEDYRRGSVFKRFGIDFCCGGGRTVQTACEKAHVPYEEVAAALLTAAESRGTGHPDPSQWSADFLADYIVNLHHGYVRESLPILRQFARKVARVHGAAQPELIAIANLVEELAEEMEAHMVKEEDQLFPYVRALVKRQEGRPPSERPPFDSVAEPIERLEHEHDHAGELMRRIRELSGDYTPPEHACNTYRALYAKLEEFEDDLHWHVHLENNVLFPRAAKLEKESLS